MFLIFEPKIIEPFWRENSNIGKISKYTKLNKYYSDKVPKWDIINSFQTLWNCWHKQIKRLPKSICVSVTFLACMVTSSSCFWTALLVHIHIDFFIQISILFHDGYSFLKNFGFGSGCIDRIKIWLFLETIYDPKLNSGLQRDTDHKVIFLGSESICHYDRDTFLEINIIMRNLSSTFWGSRIFLIAGSVSTLLLFTWNESMT